MLMNKKQFYTSPEVDVLVVRFEENIMSNPAKLMLLFDDVVPNSAGPAFTSGSTINDYGEEF